ncbi:hypothetical protein H310_14633 [Aphanomyces invadans]|uniref:Tc1-like transposase DDE domain-containing protein n=1 Tax=Aphanomyces invadans TaxID=157072 RepID=A0A024T9E9_9STRA|nr:hypothetical protein H310_14633 [Aphanomyces invadans]ETV90629.1 hypothetical protein H310_14633 [Aphanomyces invadans]|eukprot:XP_008880750.1 hypothetical protein H310_14633 [Aphanomyces invadans]
MARARGHDVVYTPPHHSDLQPIELVWSKVKGDVGEQYTVDTSFDDVRTRLADTFDALPQAVIWNCVEHCDSLLREMYQLLLSNEDDDDPPADGSSSDEASEGSCSSDSES